MISLPNIKDYRARATMGVEPTSMLGIQAKASRAKARTNGRAKASLASKATLPWYLKLRMDEIFAMPTTPRDAQASAAGCIAAE